MELSVATIADIDSELTYFAVIVATSIVGTITIIGGIGAARYAVGIATYQLRSLDHQQCFPDLSAH